MIILTILDGGKRVPFLESEAAGGAALHCMGCNFDFGRGNYRTSRPENPNVTVEMQMMQTADDSMNNMRGSPLSMSAP